jgi:antitoxin (DNA-binding transcriptional repressor) of toxin-antitoxin stability system
METATASIRELRLNFRAVKKKIEAHGSVVITDNGVPSYKIEPMAAQSRSRKPLPDYWARLQRQKSRSLSAKETDELHAENRGGR